LNVIREGGGLYFPESNQAIIQISLSDFDNSLNILKIHKNNVALAKSLNIPKGLGNFKLLAKSEQVLLSIERQERDLDDLIVLNEKGEIVECISSNIFHR
jgi:branched-subunit amino acid aminotransferase/4-amino-4-deoxychorismate lyase